MFEVSETHTIDVPTSAKLEDISGLSDLFATFEFLYILVDVSGGGRGRRAVGGSVALLAQTCEPIIIRLRMPR